MAQFSKKIYILLITVFLLIGLMGCSDGNIGTNEFEDTSNGSYSDNAKEDKIEDTIEKEAEELYENMYPVFIGVSYKENFIFSKDKVLSLYIDGEEIKKLKQGEVSGYGFILSKGKHKISVADNIINADSETFTVGEDKVLGKEAANVFIVGIAYKNGSAIITDIVGTNITEYTSEETAKLEYYERLLAFPEDFTAVGNFTEVLKKYGELYPQKGENSYWLDDNYGQVSNDTEYMPENEYDDADDYIEEEYSFDEGNDLNEEYLDGSDEPDEDHIGDDYEFVLPYSDSEYINEFDLDSLSADECRIARNEIYARHGRRFDDMQLQEYFDSCSWYEGTIRAEDFSDDVLNEVEKANLQVIVEYEESMGY